MKALVQREWRLLRTPLLLALAVQCVWQLLHGFSRSYEQLLNFEPPLVAMVFGAWVGAHRFALEQVRGTWLLQPFSRVRLVQAKLLVASASLLALALVETASRYAWVATSPEPGGPIRSVAPYVCEALPIHFASTYAVMLGFAIPMFSSPLRARAWGFGGGLAWIAFFVLDDYALPLFVPGVSLPVWHGFAFATIVLLGSLALLQAARDVGHGVAPETRIVGALWATPFAVFLMMVVASIPLAAEQDGPRVFETAVLLRDGEVVVAHFDGSGGTAVRRDGRAVSLPRRRSDGPSERAQRVVRASTPRFGQPIWFHHQRAFVAEDGRSLSFYRDGGIDAGVSCWGAAGTQHGTVHCAPGPQIIALQQVASGSGLLVVTTESVHVLDATGDHLRWQAAHVQGAAWIRDEQGLERDLAVFTEDGLVITGPTERHFPPVSLDARVYLLEDNTVAVLDHEVLTCFHASGTTTVTWPTTPDDDLSSLFIAVTFLPRSESIWLAALFRLLGAGAVIVLMRRRGVVHALLGLVLGPAYLLTAIALWTDWDTIATWLKRFRLASA